MILYRSWGVFRNLTAITDFHEPDHAPRLASVSYAFPNAKLSLDYRADLYFGAMDGGIDTTKKENVGFYGPFATVSVGVGG